ncbi:TPA: glycoside hydrolase family 36 N-terminal domain-containing protein, partial [Enterococcus faecium]
MYKDNEMNIIYRSENQQFHLFNQEISYIFKISEDGKLLHLYYGENLPDNDYSHLIEMHHRPMTTYRNENDLLYSLEHLKQEFPEYGTTDFRHPAISLLQKNGSRLSDFVYQGYEVEEGKPKLEGLPATYVDNNDESKTLKVYILDSVTNVQ